MDIKGFKNEYEFLSLGYKHNITYAGITYTNSEAAFFAQRVKDVNARAKYSRLSGNKARAKALQAEPSDTWDEYKDYILKDLMVLKFEDPLLRKKLLDTGDKRLLNINTYRDSYYGIYENKGYNILGKILMEVRDAIRKGD